MYNKLPKSGVKLFSIYFVELTYLSEKLLKPNLYEIQLLQNISFLSFISAFHLIQTKSVIMIDIDCELCVELNNV